MMKNTWGVKLILIILSFLLGVGFFVFIKDSEKRDIINASTESLIKKLESRPIEEINDEIQQIRKDTNYGVGVAKNLPGRFSNAIVIGDSITEGLLGYDVLYNSSVISLRGASISRIQKNIQTIIYRKPDVVFFQMGMNDLERYNGNSEAFILEYKKRINELRSGLPSVRIYINNILPIQQVAIDEVPANAYYSEYNVALRNMCQEMNLVYINNDFIIHNMGDAYEQDGIHPKSTFYTAWAKRMADIAGL